MVEGKTAPLAGARTAAPFLSGESIISRSLLTQTAHKRRACAISAHIYYRDSPTVPFGLFAGEELYRGKGERQESFSAAHGDVSGWLVLPA